MIRNPEELFSEKKSEVFMYYVEQLTDANMSSVRTVVTRKSYFIANLMMFHIYLFLVGPSLYDITG